MAIVCSFLVAASVVVTASSPPPAATQTPRQVVETLMFSTPLNQFIHIADSPARDRRLDWKSDACSAPVIRSTGRSFDFMSACRRHDFGYRNLSRIDRGRHWTAPMRRRVDDQFRRDMRESCSRRTALDKWRCLTWAEMFFRAVRIYAGP